MGQVVWLRNRKRIEELETLEEEYLASIKEYVRELNFRQAYNYYQILISIQHDIFYFKHGKAHPNDPLR